MFVQRLRQDGQIIDAMPDTIISADAVLAIAGRREFVLDRAAEIGTEVDDPEVLDLELTILDVVVTSKRIAAKTLLEIATTDLNEGARGVFVRKVVRTGVELPVTAGLRIDRGDVMTLVGAKRDVERAAPLIGYADRDTEQTDMVVMGAGIVIGALIGAVTFHVGGVPLSLSTSGGALIAGLVCGWLRSVNRTFGRIPAPALWVFNNIGLNTFIAAVGIIGGAGLRGRSQGPGA